MVLIPLVAAYVEALGTFVVTVNDLVQEINFVALRGNVGWVG